MMMRRALTYLGPSPDGHLDRLERDLGVPGFLEVPAELVGDPEVHAELPQRLARLLEELGQRRVSQRVVVGEDLAANVAQLVPATRSRVPSRRQLVRIEGGRVKGIGQRQPTLDFVREASACL